MAKTITVDDETMTEAQFEKKLLASHWGGQAGSLEEAAGEARTQAGKFFSIGNDDEAKQWRYFATWLDERAKKARATQKPYMDPRLA